LGLSGVGLVTAVGVTTALVVGAPAVAPTQGTTAQADELQRFGSCAEVRRWYAAAALDRVTAWGFDGPPVMFFGGLEDRVSALGGPAFARASESPGVANGATGTNVQEAGVDEPDLAKTDGKLLVLLDGISLVLADATGQAPDELARLTLPNGRPEELLLVDDRVLVFGSSGRTTTITTVDIADPSAPGVVADEAIDGKVVSAREHDGTVRLVVSSTPRLDFVTPRGTTSMKEARATNRQIVRDARAIDWLPTRTAAGGDLDEREQGGETTRLVRCADVRHPDKESGLGTVSVLTIDPSDPSAYETTAVTADGSMVYASDDRLYVATTLGGWDDVWGWRGSALSRVAAPRRTVTEIHAFAVTGADTTYAASGKVAGTAPDRWAFSEHQGLLRVATMVGNDWSPRASAVTVLEESADDLRTVGRVGGMGERETIRAVRWFGDLAVLVTFRQVDPLYTVDLSDPTDPRVLGELKIPGFSEYLHPVGADLLLGVGQDANRRGRSEGAQVSTFDLSDRSAPTRVAALDLNAGHSPVERDSRAFTYLPADRLALVPIAHWRKQPAVAVVRVTAAGTLTRVDSVAASGSADSLRALPLADGRIAVVGGGEALKLVALPR
ncbi:MAG: beta-propeller domain-containing protein, partial [Actinomycetota bacterium]|nr:beta-propeller domain-containing protein [Actinomycetota bacterium]